MHSSFKNFYQRFGLTNFPFDTFTTEHETAIASDIFVSQSEYDPIIDAFSGKRNAIILGERGSGKTAILEDFKRQISNKRELYVLISDYSMMPNPPTTNDIYKLIITNLLVALFTKINRQKIKLLFLNKADKILLSYLLSTFLPTYSQNQLKDRISKVQIPFWVRSFNWLYNRLRAPLNIVGTAGKNLVYQYLLKHFTFLPIIENENQIQEFFPELKLNVEYDFFSQDISFSLLQKVADICNKLGYSKPIVMIDRLDEDSRFENDAQAISEFINPFLSDGKLLSIDSIQLVFFVWSTPFRFIEDNIRTQKYFCPSLRWSKADLEKLLNKRLAYYSNSNLVNYRSMFENNVSDNTLDEIFELANSNPRDLIHIFKKLLTTQYEINAESHKIEQDTIGRALTEFVSRFNYYEYYPRKSNAQSNTMDIYSYSAHLFKLDDIEFTKNRLNEKAQTGGSTNNYVVNMEKIGLVEKIRAERGNAIYKIKDPKIIYALRNKIEIRQ